ncbi:hypothetical protein ES703_20547 [subsurface metagenome]
MYIKLDGKGGEIGLLYPLGAFLRGIVTEKNACLSQQERPLGAFQDCLGSEVLKIDVIQGNVSK